VWRQDLDSMILVDPFQVRTFLTQGPGTGWLCSYGRDLIHCSNPVNELHIPYMTFSQQT